MQHIINMKLSIALAAVTLAFGFALPAFAESNEYTPNEYKNLEIELEVKSDSTKVEYSYENQYGDEKEGGYEYGTTDLDEVYVKLTEKFGISLKEVKDAVTDIEDEDASDEDDGSNNDDEDKDEDREKEKERCDVNIEGKEKRCFENKKLDEKKEWKRENYGERFKDFGKSADKEVLNAQLRELLTILIQLLQAQAKLEN
jgi:hypothetical protein